MSSTVWYCPSCNNGEPQLIIFAELEAQRKALSLLTTNYDDFVVSKKCSSCDRTWFFNPSKWSVTTIERGIETVETDGNE